MSSGSGSGSGSGTQPLLLPSSEELKDSYTLYRTRIADVFLARVLAFFAKLMDDVWTQCVHANELDKHLMQFQNALVGVSRWTRLALEKERDILVQTGDIDDLNVTISCLLVLQAKLLSFVCPGQQKHAITLDLPDDCMFVHHIYIACARIAWSNAGLFHRRVDSLTQQHNHAQLRALLRECIHDTIDKYVPMKDIQRALLDKHEEARTEIVVGQQRSAEGGGFFTTTGVAVPAAPPQQQQQQQPMHPPVVAPPQLPLLSWNAGGGVAQPMPMHAAQQPPMMSFEAPPTPLLPLPPPHAPASLSMFEAPQLPIMPFDALPPPASFTLPSSDVGEFALPSLPPLPPLPSQHDQPQQLPTFSAMPTLELPPLDLSQISL